MEKFLIFPLEGHSETGQRVKPAKPERGRIKEDIPCWSDRDILCVSPPCSVAWRLSYVFSNCGTTCPSTFMLFSQWRAPTCKRWEGERRMMSRYLYPRSLQENSSQIAGSLHSTQVLPGSPFHTAIPLSHVSGIGLSSCILTAHSPSHKASNPFGFSTPCPSLL